MNFPLPSFETTQSLPVPLDERTVGHRTAIENSESGFRHVSRVCFKLKKGKKKHFSFAHNEVNGFGKSRLDPLPGSRRAPRRSWSLPSSAAFTYARWTRIAAPGYTQQRPRAREQRFELDDASLAHAACCIRELRDVRRNGRRSRNAQLEPGCRLRVVAKRHKRTWLDGTGMAKLAHVVT